MAQIVINVFGVLLFLPFISQFAALVSNTSEVLPRQIANAHTIFNLTVSAVLFPFVKQIAWVARKLAPEKAGLEKPKLTSFIDDMQLSVPSVALNEAAREMTKLAEVTAQMVEDSSRALIEKDRSLAERVIVQEDEFVDPVFKKLVDFVDRLIQDDLTSRQTSRCFQIKNLSMDIERVADLSEDIAQYALEKIKDDVPFTPEALEELQQASKLAHDIYALAITAFSASDKAMAGEVCHRENDFDRLYWRFRQNHIERLEAGMCHPRADVIFTETMRALERISDHADNIGVSIARSADE
jgi:phosphate:Na+ symporter